MSETAIRICQFTKEYVIPKQKEKRIAVHNLDLDVPTGGLFGFLGPNGAGKTTTIKMLLGFIAPSLGNAWLFGKPVADDTARQRVGYLPEHPYFPKFLSAQEIIRAHAGLSGLTGAKAKKRIDECLEQVGMAEHRHLPISKCSKGMAQRIGLATALVSDPDLLILDEPSSGLDPIGRKELRELLTRLKSEGKTIFLSSHLLTEMEPLCDRVGVLAHGKLVACGAPSEITETRDEIAVLFEPNGNENTLTEQVVEIGGRLENANTEGRVRILIPTGKIYRALGLLEKQQAKLVAVSPQRETLEDAFLRLVG